MINLETRIRASELIDVLMKDGFASVTWLAQRPAAEVAIRFDVDVEEEDAAEALPSSYFNDDADVTEWEPDDLGDLRGFIAACLTGDRHGAIALLPRLGLSDRAQEHAERALRAGAAA